MRFLKVEGLCKSFGGLQAINNVDFVIEEGEIIGLIIPNGSGKTTILNLLTGFLKPNAGTVAFKGDGTGNVLNPLIQWKNGQLELVWSAEHATTEFLYPAPPFGER
jgi:branched-chain amino acid transport system ATP-binding protein